MTKLAMILNNRLSIKKQKADLLYKGEKGKYKVVYTLSRSRNYHIEFKKFLYLKI